LTKAILISIAIAVLGFIPFMGLPGALVFLLSKPYIYLAYGPMAFEAFEQSLGDSAWPLMLALAVLWPISIPIAYGLSQKIFGDLPFFSLEQLIPFCIFVLIGTTIISSLTISMNFSFQRLSDSEILEQALINGKLSLVKNYWNAKENTTYSFSDPLFIALINNQAKVAHYLLDNGVNPQQYAPDFKNYEPRITPLHTATKKGMIDTVKKLLKLGVNPNIRSTNGKVPLHNLGKMKKNMLPIIELFKTYKANFAAVDNDGNTPLITMVSINAPLEYRPILAQKLIEYGCPIEVKNNKGQTALDIVQEQQAYDHKLIAVLSSISK